MEVERREKKRDVSGRRKKETPGDRKAMENTQT
jgi:hypothetical protein